MLVGPSGCGKSTALRLIAGLEAPTAGRVFIDNKDVTQLQPKDRDVAMVFQNYALYPHLTVFDNMAFGLKMRKTPKAEITLRVVETARSLGIEPLLNRRPASLSGGEQQRVALGRAMVRRPRVLLLDEPLANLDASLRLATRAELKRLHREFKITTIHVTHDQEEAMALADRIVVMREGRIQQVGTPQEIYDRPVNRFVGGFLGTPPMRFIEGTLRVNGSSAFMETVAGSMPVSIGNSAQLRLHVGQAVCLGFRAEDVRFIGSGSKEKDASPSTKTEAFVSIPVRVELVEPLGHCFHLGLRTETGLELVSRAPSVDRVSMGTTGRVVLDIQTGHLFSATGDGERLN